MPSLQWIGKDKVVHHHLDVPFHILEHSYGFVDGVESNEKANSGNKIIHGDNLVALKSLLPEYEGKVNCIYIDPPYNTGNEGWVYNDNVNDPKIKKWLGEVVGKVSEDLTRHDKWLCMMYPRLKLLHKLLADDGVIFISIDDNEVANLRLLLDEIFGWNNFVGIFVVNSTPNARDYGHIGKMHEYCIVFAKNFNNYESNELEVVDKKFKYSDEKGGYNIHPLYNSNEAFTNLNRPNLYYPFYINVNEMIDNEFYKISLEKAENSIEIFPPKSVKNNVQFVWRWGREKSTSELNKEIIGYKTGDGEFRIVQKMRSTHKIIRSILDDITFTSRKGTAEVEKIFGSKQFNFPKPVKLLQDFIFTATSPNSIILDSFAGSGTTAHAVLNLNKKDGGNRKFILVEMEDYANSITAERVKRVINGYADVEGTGGAFDYFTIGDALFTDDGLINESVGVTALREYIYFTETQEQCNPNGNSNPYFLGLANDCSYYFYYIPEQVTTLNAEFLSTITLKSSQYVIYADTCALDEVTLLKNAIIFKKIPRDITRI